MIKMYRSFEVFAAMLAAALLLCGCGKDVLLADEPQAQPEQAGQGGGDALLMVRTMRAAQDTPSGDEPATVSYPIHVYVLRTNGTCAAVQTLTDADDELSIALNEGTYSLTAIAGATATDYALPALDDAPTTESLVAPLDDATVTQSDLMTARVSSLTLSDGATNTVSLQLQRRVMCLDAVTISQVPFAATAVTLTVAPLWRALSLGAQLSDGGHAYTVALSRQSDGRTWTASPSVFLLPPSEQPATVSVSITTPDGTFSYTYNSTDELQAGWRLTLNGTYTEAIGVTLTGTVSGATWLGDRTINFDLGSGTATDNDNSGSGSSEVPEAGTLYNHCYVLSATPQPGGMTRVVLLSPHEAAIGFAATAYSGDALNEHVEAVIADNATADFTGWRLPTQDELATIYASTSTRNAINTTLTADGGTGFTAGATYVVGTAATGWKYYSTATTSDPLPGFMATDKVRPVVTVDL
jgi:hypothetical protein